MAANGKPGPLFVFSVLCISVLGGHLVSSWESDEAALRGGIA
jgi:hypothetical protein